MSGKTGGRRAYDAWWATAEGVPRHPDVTYDQDGAAWEAAAAAGAASAHQRVAELVTEGNELRGRIGELRTLAAEMYAHITSGDDYARPDKMADWRKRLGPEPAVVAAGTEHLVPLIRGLAIPDEES